jgi:PIN domain nuclease of toxin-antitoxin system
MRKQPVKPASNVVLDSSAVLALILRELGGSRVDALLAAIESSDTVHVAISSVNWCEILTRLHRENPSMTAQELDALLGGVELVAFGKAEAEFAAGYSCTHPELSLGDRACLALASMRKATAWTTDKIWARAKMGVTVEILR